MKIGFLGDFFLENLQGGGELNDSVLIDYLENKHTITKYWCSRADIKSLEKEDAYIISNFTTLSTVIRDWIAEKKYIIYEHDHKYVKPRDVSKYKNFNIPIEDLTHVNFYKKAEKVIVLSKVCKDVMEKNNISNCVYNIGCSLWSDNTLDFISKISTSEKKYKFAVVNSSNSVKGYVPAISYCQKNNIQPHLIKSNNYHDFLKQLSECENLIFFPQVLETFSRLAAEAKMLNCNLITTPKMLGFASEEYSSLKGIELVNKIRDQKNKALTVFEDWCNGV
jgi:hypothetical protein